MNKLFIGDTHLHQGQDVGGALWALTGHWAGSGTDGAFAFEVRQ